MHSWAMRLTSYHSLLVVLLGLTPLLLGCARPSQNTGNLNLTPDVPPGGVLKVAMILPGPKDDQAWSQAGYHALLEVQAKLQAEVTYRESVLPEQVLEVTREFEKSGYEFVVGHGAQYMAPLEQAAQEFPDLDFAIISDYHGNNRNFGGLSFKASEQGYITGYIAGIKTKTNHIAYLGGVSQQNMQDQARAFQAGAKAANPDVTVDEVFVGSWTDAQATKEAFEQLVSGGADVLALNVQAGVGALHQSAEQQGLLTIGFNVDQHKLAPKAVVTSAVSNLDVLLVEAAQLVRQGRWEGRLYQLGFHEGAISLAPFHDHLSAAEADQVQQLINDISAGRIVTE